MRFSQTTAVILAAARPTGKWELQKSWRLPTKPKEASGLGDGSGVAVGRQNPISIWAVDVLICLGQPWRIMSSRSSGLCEWCVPYPSAARKVKHAAGVQLFGQPEVTADTGQAEDGAEDLLSVRLAS